jgi:hypothetical protein
MGGVGALELVWESSHGQARSDPPVMIEIEDRPASPQRLETETQYNTDGEAKLDPGMGVDSLDGTPLAMLCKSAPL